jgi:hypothetical protein
MADQIESWPEYLARKAAAGEPVGSDAEPAVVESWPEYLARKAAAPAPVGEPKAKGKAE